MNKEVKQLLSQYDYPVEYLKYSGSEDIYFVFNFDDERGSLFGDDEVIEEVYSLQVHFFSPESFNHIDLKKKIKKDLKKAGWTFPSVNTFYEDDTKINHVVFSCEKER